MFRALLATVVATLLVLQLAAASPIQDSEDPIKVGSIQFSSKANEREICTAYHMNGKMFVTPTSCLGDDASAINKIRELDVVGQGKRAVQAFPLRADGSESTGDITVLMYDGAFESEPVSAGIIQKFGMQSLMRVARQDPPPAGAAPAGNSTAAGLDGRNIRLIGAALTFVGSVMLMP